MHCGAAAVWFKNERTKGGKSSYQACVFALLLCI